MTSRKNEGLGDVSLLSPFLHWLCFNNMIFAIYFISPSPRQGATLIHACQKNHSIHTIHTDELYTRTVPAPPSSPTETTRTPLYLLSRRQLTRVVNRPCLPMLKTSVLGEADIQCIGEADTTYRRCIGRAQRGFGHIRFISFRTKPIFNIGRHSGYDISPVYRASAASVSGHAGFVFLRNPCEIEIL